MLFVIPNLIATQKFWYFIRLKTLSYDKMHHNKNSCTLSVTTNIYDVINTYWLKTAVPIHHSHLQKLATKFFKVVSGVLPEIMKTKFQEFKANKK